jgi:hypothetical protein
MVLPDDDGLGNAVVDRAAVRMDVVLQKSESKFEPNAYQPFA